jgi:hypothetical protein
LLGRPVCSAEQAASDLDLEGPPAPAPVLGWVETAQVVVRVRVRPFLQSLRILLCDACCAPEAVVPGTSLLHMIQ